MAFAPRLALLAVPSIPIMRSSISSDRRHPCPILWSNHRIHILDCLQYSLAIIPVAAIPELQEPEECQSMRPDGTAARPKPQQV